MALSLFRIFSSRNEPIEDMEIMNIRIVVQTLEELELKQCTYSMQFAVQEHTEVHTTRQEKIGKSWVLYKLSHFLLPYHFQEFHD